jgi:hypothetical protein
VGLHLACDQRRRDRRDRDWARLGVSSQRVPAALLIVLLGIFATMAIGNLAAGVKLLAKRTDPIIAFYQIAVFIFAGVAYPITPFLGR